MSRNVAYRIWVAASTHQGKEPVALANLKNQGFPAYCPMIRKRTRHARRQREVLRPLFPGYLFIRLDPLRDQWRPILSTIGIRTLIRFGDRFGIVPQGFVESLQAREEDNAVPLPRPRDNYAPGEQVRLREGPLEGIVASVLHCDEGARLTLLMDLLCREVTVKASIDGVVPA